MGNTPTIPNTIELGLHKKIKSILRIFLFKFVITIPKDRFMEKYLNSFGFFSKEEIAEVSKIGTYQEIKKGEFFFKGDKICEQVAFVKKGIFRHFYPLDSGEEVTYCFTFFDNFITAYSSFVTNKPTKEHIQALTDAKIFVLPRWKVEELTNTQEGWMKFSKKIAEKQYIKREDRILLLQKEKAKFKYEYLLQTKPEYLQNIPLQYLASYIGVTQRHLSRLRREIAF